MVSISDAQREPLPWLNWQGTVYHGLPLGPLHLPAGTRAVFGIPRAHLPREACGSRHRHRHAWGMPLKIAAKVDPTDQEYFEAEIAPQLCHPLVEYVGELGEGEKDAFFGECLRPALPYRLARALRARDDRSHGVRYARSSPSGMARCRR